MPDDQIDVVLVEDNDVFRQTLELLLDVTPDVRVVASVPNGEAALDVWTASRRPPGSVVRAHAPRSSS
jgi:DNA-binding NarL/FixJ family response regulator